MDNNQLNFSGKNAISEEAIAVCDALDVKTEPKLHFGINLSNLADAVDGTRMYIHGTNDKQKRGKSWWITERQFWNKIEKAKDERLKNVAVNDYICQIQKREQLAYPNEMEAIYPIIYGAHKMYCAIHNKTIFVSLDDITNMVGGKVVTNEPPALYNIRSNNKSSSSGRNSKPFAELDLIKPVYLEYQWIFDKFKRYIQTELKKRSVQELSVYLTSLTNFVHDDTQGRFPCFYLIHVKRGLYKYGITYNFGSRMLNHKGKLKFLSLVSIIHIGSTNQTLKMEDEFGKFMQDIGFRVKYDCIKQEIVPFSTDKRGLMTELIQISNEHQYNTAIGFLRQYIQKNHNRCYRDTLCQTVRNIASTGRLVTTEEMVNPAGMGHYTLFDFDFPTGIKAVKRSQATLWCNPYACSYTDRMITAYKKLYSKIKFCEVICNANLPDFGELSNLVNKHGLNHVSSKYEIDLKILELYVKAHMALNPEDRINIPKYCKLVHRSKDEKQDASKKRVRNFLKLGSCIDCNKGACLGCMRCLACHKKHLISADCPSNDRELRKMLNDGMTFVQIAKRFDVNFDRVRSWCKHFGISKPNKRTTKATRPPCEQCGKHCCEANQKMCRQCTKKLSLIQTANKYGIDDYDILRKEMEKGLGKTAKCHKLTPTKLLMIIDDYEALGIAPKPFIVREDVCTDTNVKIKRCTECDCYLRTRSPSCATVCRQCSIKARCIQEIEETRRPSYSYLKGLLHKHGYDETAKQFEVNNATITNWINKYEKYGLQNYVRKTTGKYSRECPVKVINKCIDCGKNSTGERCWDCRSKVLKPNKGITKNGLQKCLDQKYSMKQIEDKYKCSNTCLRKHFKRHGLIHPNSHAAKRQNKSQ